MLLERCCSANLRSVKAIISLLFEMQMGGYRESFAQFLGKWCVACLRGVPITFGGSFGKLAAQKKEENAQFSSSFP